MRTHTSNYKNQIKLLGRQFDSKITYTLNNEEIELGVEDLNSITPLFQGALLKSVMKQIEIDSNQEIPLGTEINCQFGLKVNGEYEYLNFGNYVVNKVEKQEDKYSWIITAYDKMLYSMKDYETLPITYPITIRGYISSLCTKLGLTFANEEDEFCNYDRVISNELFLDANGGSLGFTYRDVLDQIAEVTGSIVCINNDDELELRYINETNDTIDEEYLKDINVKFGEKFGPVNSIVLSRSAESDNIYLSDDESIEENGLTEIKIKDNQFMNFNDRDEYLPDLFETLDGIEFYINDYSSTGITYLELGDMYNVSVFGETYKCLMLNDTLEIKQGISEDIFTDRPEKEETDYKKSDKTDNRINQAYIIVNKQKQEITALTSKVNQLGDSYTKEQVNQLIQNAETGVTNTFSEAGGNNIFRNTGLWFEDNSTVDTLICSNDLICSDNLILMAEPYYEYWTGKVLKMQEDKASNRSALLLQNTTLSQEQIVPNGTYTISFKYNRLINLSSARCVINGMEISLNGEPDTEVIKTIEVSSQYIKISFICDTDSGCEIYDLMVNAGSVKLAYSQNQNETTTDTVNISKGITITSSDTNTTFKADSDGIRVFNNNDLTNPVTDFTEVGMDTDVAVIKERAEVVGVLFKKVGNNVWINRL